MTVLHYKSNFLNPTETFIERVISNHNRFEPVGMCINPRSYINGLRMHSKPTSGWEYAANTLCFHLNWCLPFYLDTIKKVQPDIVHAHFGFDGYRMMKPCQKLNIPLIVSFYGSDVSRLPKEFDWPRRYRKLAQTADAFIAATDHMKERLVTLGFPKSKIAVIPFGLDLEKFKFSENHAKANRIMMVGRMVEKKGFRYAIEAIHQLKKEGKKYTLDLFGDGKLRESLEQKVQALGMENQISFHGYVPVEQVLQEHANHNLLLAPSRTAHDGDEEGLPNTILEAMASGTAVITTNHAAIGDLIDNNVNGLIIEEANSRALAQAIQFAASADCNLKELRINARKTIESQFEIHSVVSQIESLYNRVILNYD